ncbi:MAG TPA: hypothetical protein PLX89_07075 [Verrucomicrobiota bacterium]|nr:hypothetical protein [Verrucomicrobiales bacterium]HRI12753.1 hypothetical protein [Verrucomicrobiota bacterium]
MNIKITSVATALWLAASAGLNAGETGQTKPNSPEFERMKSLVGTWIGKTDMGQGPIDLTLHYRLLAGGSVLEERCFVGTPNEMVTMYYDQGGKLAMTHYCLMGNRPGMLLKSADAKTLKFDFDASCGINPTKESHMHALTITFNDANTITTSCRAIVDGQEMPEKPTTLKRADS